MIAIAHGGALDRAMAEFGGTKADWLDLSTGINPDAYPVPAIDPAAWHRLPDEAQMEACLAAARRTYGVPTDAAICAAPGTQALIQRLPDICGRESATIITPTYGEYAHVFVSHGRVVHECRSWPDRLGRGMCLVAGNPNNPDGRFADRAKVKQILANVADDALVIIDEAFCDMTPERSLASMAGRPGLLVLRSFGKFYGLAGLRLGFAIGDATLISQLQGLLGPWAVSGPALAVGQAALDDEGWRSAATSTLKASGERLHELIQKAGLKPEGATGLFVLGSHPDSSVIANTLAKQHILVRTFDHDHSLIRFGLPANDAGFMRLQTALERAMQV